MSERIWILSSLDKESEDKNREKLNEYINLAIKKGDLIKLSYVNEDVQEFFRLRLNGNENINSNDPHGIDEYLPEFQSCDKILFVDENGYEERKVDFSNNTNGFIFYNDINDDKDNWLEFGGLNVAEPKGEIIKIKEKTDKFGFLLVLLPYIFFISSYNRKFTFVLTISTLLAIIILGYKSLKKQKNLLNLGIASFFIFLSGMRFISPYWINSISAIFLTLGICLLFLLGELVDKSILSLYYKTSLRDTNDYRKFTLIWIITFLFILGNIIYFGRVSFLISGWLLGVVWIITSVNLRGCETEL
ncbi:MAG: hypothetical protein ACRDA4_09955 [Filifactoraceae bacterium]